jgi:hypothetical protein
LPDRDDELRRELDRLARPGDPRGAFDRVAQAKRRLRVMRRVQAVVLAVAVVAGTAGTVLALDRVFRPSTRPGDQPEVGPTLTTSPSPSTCPWPGVILAGDLDTRPEDYRPIGPAVTGDVLGDGSDARIQLFEDSAQHLRCRYVLVVQHPSGVGYAAPVRSFDWLPDQPTILMTAEVDGQDGIEIVIDIGGPGHPHRSGQVFTFEPGGPTGDGSVVPMELRPPQGIPILFPIGGEFAAGVDCVDEPGTIVVTVGGLAAGGDSHYDITRTLSVAQQGTFVEVSSKSFIVPVGEEEDRWPELAEDPFRSCPPG